MGRYPLYLLAFCVLGAIPFTMGCQTPSSNPGGCTSGQGNIKIQNISGEAIVVTLKDDAGELPAIKMAARQTITDAEPVGTYQITITGQSTHATLLSGSYVVSCDQTSALTVRPAPSFTVSVTLGGTGQGSVVSSPVGIQCGPTCSGPFAEGTSVVLTATAHAGSKFTGWSGACAGASLNCTVTVDRALDVTASFDAVVGSYPAAHPPVPQILYNGGPIIKNPVIVPVSFSNDNSATVSAIELFLGQLVGSPYWTTITADYAIGAATTATAVHAAETAPATIDDTAIQTWLAGKLNAKEAAFGTPTNRSLYVLQYPSTSTVTLLGLTSCVDFYGYHGHVQIAGGLQVAYAVIARCTGTGIPDIDRATEVTTHEIAEAASNPLWDTQPAYSGIDNDHAFWATYLSPENGDLCQFNYDPITPAGLSHSVQRIWSNTSAAAGHDPCVPQPTGDVYFNSAPALTDNVSYVDSGGSVKTKGIVVPVGTSKTLEVDLYSDGPTTAPWTVSASQLWSNGNVQFSFDKASGQNGDKLNLTIKVNSGDTTGYHAEFFEIKSSLNGVSHYWYGVISQTAIAGAAAPGLLPLQRLGERIYRIRGPKSMRY